MKKNKIALEKFINIVDKIAFKVDNIYAPRIDNRLKKINPSITIKQIYNNFDLKLHGNLNNIITNKSIVTYFDVTAIDSKHETFDYNRSFGMLNLKKKEDDVEFIFHLSYEYAKVNLDNNGIVQSIIIPFVIKELSIKYESGFDVVVNKNSSLDSVVGDILSNYLGKIKDVIMNKNFQIVNEEVGDSENNTQTTDRKKKKYPRIDKKTPREKYPFSRGRGRRR